MTWETVNVDTDDDESPHLVQVGDEGFDCLTCGARNLGDGYTLTLDGAQEWHDRLGQ